MLFFITIITFMLSNLQDEKALMSPSRVLPLNSASVTLDLVTLKTPLVSSFYNIHIHIIKTVSHM